MPRINRMALAMLGLGLLAAPANAAEAANENLWVYFGTYTGGGSKGIYVSSFNTRTGELGEPKLAAETAKPSFLEVHPNGRYVYAVGEIADFGGKKAGGVTAFEIDPKTGLLKTLNSQSSGGTGPCHISLDADGRTAYVANYGGGSVASLPIEKDGRLGEANSFHQHEGSSVNPARQKGPHAHSINLDPTGKFAVAADLGLDKLLVYSVDPKTGALVPKESSAFATPPGGGPRHFAFHPNGKFAYTNLEISREIAALNWDAEHGQFDVAAVHSTLPDDAEATGSTAETRVHPNGKFVYVSNRGHDSIAGFRVDPKTGALTSIGHFPSGGKTPRNFNLDPTGNWAFAANQNSGNVVLLKVDPKTGLLKPTGREIGVGNPVCVRFAPAE